MFLPSVVRVSPISDPCLRMVKSLKLGHYAIWWIEVKKRPTGHRFGMLRLPDFGPFTVKPCKTMFYPSMPRCREQGRGENAVFLGSWIPWIPMAPLGFEKQLSVTGLRIWYDHEFDEFVTICLFLSKSWGFVIAILFDN